jgi:hypothetical protein
MLGSTVLDVAIGLVFVFLLLSLICSAANELVEMALKNRAKDLEKGISELIGSSAATTQFMAEIYDHGLVNSLFRGQYQTISKWKLPSYIPARNFALAILDVKAAWTTAGAVEKTLPNNVKTAIEALEKTAAGDAKKLQESVEDWYNSAMDRVSGWYKRRTQTFILVMGLIVAIAVNVDCVEIAQRLSSDASLRQGVVALAEAAGKGDQTKDANTQAVDVIKENIKTLNGLGLPIGWPDNAEKPSWGRALYASERHCLGWILTALAVSLGAPFWFDMLNKLIVVRSTVKPHEKSREEGSKDAKR